ncbi:MAG: hypothetical protein WCT77_10060 [Bacteroidota bacterium]
MKLVKFILYLIVILTVVISGSDFSSAQDTTKPAPKKTKVEPKFKEEIPENLRYFKETYDTTYQVPFEIVYKAIKKSIEEMNCMISKQTYSQTEKGLYKGIIRSDACLFTQDPDSTFDVLKKYSIDMPIIRGGRWVNGRMMYKFTITEVENGKVHFLLKADLSGFEEHVTYLVHFWKSNGWLETLMMERVDKNIKLLNM